MADTALNTPKMRELIIYKSMEKEETSLKDKFLKFLYLHPLKDKEAQQQFIRSHANRASLLISFFILPKIGQLGLCMGNIEMGLEAMAETPRAARKSYLRGNGRLRGLTLP